MRALLSQSSHRIPRLATTVVQVMALLWLAIGLHIFHPLFHRHASAKHRVHRCCGCGWSRTSSANSSHGLPTSISAPCPICSLSAIGGTSYVAAPATVCPPMPRVAPRHQPADALLFSCDDSTHRARAPPIASCPSALT